MRVLNISDVKVAKDKENGILNISYSVDTDCCKVSCLEATYNIEFKFISSMERPQGARPEKIERLLEEYLLINNYTDVCFH